MAGWALDRARTSWTVCARALRPFARLTRNANAAGVATLAATVPVSPGDIVGTQAFAVQDGTAGESVSSMPAIFEILEPTVGACVDYTETFETTGWPYLGWTSTSGGPATGSVTAEGFYGSYSLLDPEWIYYDATYAIEPGTIITGTMRPGTGRLYLGFDSDSAGTRSFVLAPNTGDIRFQDNPGYSYTELTTTVFTWPTGWVDFILQITSESSAEGILLDAATGVELARVSQTYGSPFTRGGLSLRAFGSTYLDQIEVFVMSSAARAQLLWMVCGLACSASTETPSTKDTGPGDPTSTETYTSSSDTKHDSYMERHRNSGRAGRAGATDVPAHDHGRHRLPDPYPLQRRPHPDAAICSHRGAQRVSCSDSTPAPPTRWALSRKASIPSRSVASPRLIYLWPFPTSRS